MTLSQTLLKHFPLPSHISMPAVGLDISDHSVKFLELIRTHGGFKVGRYGTKEIPAGIIVGGTIARRDALVEILKGLRKEHKITFASVSLPEEPGYIFTTVVPKVSPNEVRSLLRFKLEEHVPVAPADAVVDFDVVAGEAAQGHQIVAVSVFPERLAADYAGLLHDAGFTPVALEIEAQAIARALVPKGETKGCMVIDVGQTRSGITVVGGGAVRFTTTVEVGGDMLSKAIYDNLPNATPEEVLRIKNEEGLMYRGNEAIQEEMARFATTLKNHIERYYVYWQTHKDAKEVKLPEHQITKIYLSGGYANVHGLPEFLTRELRVPADRANVWVNVCDIGDYIPPIPRQDSFGYASSIGLALYQG